MINEKDISRIKYLIEKGKKYGLFTPNHFLVYLRQQGYEKITENEIISLI